MASEILAEPEILRDYLVELLQAKEDLRGVKVLSRKSARLQNEIERSLGREGLLLVVLVSELAFGTYQTATLCAPKTKITVRAVENPLNNKTGKSACFLALRAASAIHMHTPPFAWSGEILCQRAVELDVMPRDAEDEDESEYASWDVEAEAKISIQPRSTTN